jgi:hypothetical protein
MVRSATVCDVLPELVVVTFVPAVTATVLVTQPLEVAPLADAPFPFTVSVVVLLLAGSTDCAVTDDDDVADGAALGWVGDVF